MIERTLGDVSGLDDLIQPNYALLPGDESVFEINMFGEQVTSEDPFAYNVGFLDQPQGGEGAQAKRDPMRSSHLPSAEHYAGSNDPYYDPSTNTASGTASGTPESHVDVSGFTSEQVSNAQAIVDTGKEVGATDRDVQVAIMAAMVESNLANLDYGDRDSVGMFQQRDAWGTREDRLDPHKSARMFFLGGAGGQEGLLDIPDRDSRDMGDLAQDVQVSAYPERYAERQADAEALLASLGPGKTTHGQLGNDPYGLTERDGEVLDNMTAAALDAAAAEFGSDFSIMQGGHSDYSGSGNTHEGLGVVDINVPNGDWAGAMTAMRKIGFAAWVRNVPGYGYAGDGAHIHAVLIGNEKLSPEAAIQVQSYLNNDDGLQGSRADDGPREFINNRFVWGETKKQRPAWRDQAVRQAKAFLGTPFKWGGEDYDGVDTVGFVRNVYSKLGIDLPKMGLDLLNLEDTVPVEDAEVGDLIAWDRDSGDSHFGILVDGGLVISVDRPGSAVQLDHLGDVTSAWGIPIAPILERQPKTPGVVDPFSYDAPAPKGPSFPAPSTPSAPVVSSPQPLPQPNAPGSGGGNPPSNPDIRTGPGGQGGGYTP